jgi:leader peptidase (prepilin peptidase)/N-methyltransferase
LPYLFFLLGAIFGSFANVIIVRLPKEESIAFPGSHCRSCQKKIAFYDNIPLVSYLFLRGKCRHCGAKIGWRYFAVELIMAALFSFCFYHIGFQWFLLEALILCFGLVVITFIDIDHMIIPDTFSIGGMLIGLVGAAINPEREFTSALIGLLAGGGVLWLVAYIYVLMRKEEGMGGGDIKLLAWIGAVLGWPAIPFVIIVSSLIGSVVGLSVAFKTKGGLKQAIPFGPFLALAAVIYLFGGDQIAFWYLRLFFPWM